MENIEITKDMLDLLSSNAPLVYVGYQRDPKLKDAEGWLREGEELPADVFRVMIKQKFPVVTGGGFIDANYVSYYIYVGRLVNVSSLLVNSDLLRDDVRDALLDGARNGISSAVVVDVAEQYNTEDKVYMYPMLRGDFQVSSFDELKQAVKTIGDLHGGLIQKPINDGIKTFRKTL